MNDLLGWISRNNAAAFFLGCFLLFVMMLLAELLVKLTRSITGNYPPAPVSRLCDADDPCYCCREGECDSSCRCSQEEDDDGA